MHDKYYHVLDALVTCLSVEELCSRLGQEKPTDALFDILSNLGAQGWVYSPKENQWVQTPFGRDAWEAERQSRGYLPPEPKHALDSAGEIIKYTTVSALKPSFTIRVDCWGNPEVRRIKA